MSRPIWYFPTRFLSSDDNVSEQLWTKSENLLTLKLSERFVYKARIFLLVDLRELFLDLVLGFFVFFCFLYNISITKSRTRKVLY